MKQENIDLFLRIYDKCLRYGQTNSNLEYVPLLKNPKDLFKERLENNNLHKAVYVFSGEPNNYGREVFLYYAYRLKFLDKKGFTDLLFAIYNATDSYTSFFSYYPYETTLKMFSMIDIPYVSNDEWNDYPCLPDTISIYRGITTIPTDIEKCGFSWSLKQNIAQACAFANNTSNTGFVVSGHILKTDIIAYLTNRGEAEIIIAPEKVKNKSINALNRTLVL